MHIILRRSKHTTMIFDGVLSKLTLHVKLKNGLFREICCSLWAHLLLTVLLKYQAYFTVSLERLYFVWAYLLVTALPISGIFYRYFPVLLIDALLISFTKFYWGFFLQFCQNCKDLIRNGNTCTIFNTFHFRRAQE